MKEDGGIFISILKVIGNLVPGTYLKTFTYLNCISAPRKFLRKSLGAFYRMDHVYDVLTELKTRYKGNASILEFGVADGYALVKKLYAARYLKVEDRVVVHGFDTFEGLPEVTSSADDALVRGAEWTQGHYHGRYENLLNYCRSKYDNVQLHRGLFEETITDEFLQTLVERPPILIWIDCDYYTSTKAVFERLIPYIPTGCIVYFDDINFNFRSRLTGEMRVVWEINQGKFGEGIELVPDPDLSLSSDRIYRFVNVNQDKSFELLDSIEQDPVRRRRDDSPLP